VNRVAATGLALLLATAPVGAVAEEPASEADEFRVEWSATGITQYRWIESPEDDNHVAGFFDQYEFTPNKSSSAAFELGLRDGALDLFRGEDEPVFQLRFLSPTSNLGVSGSQADDPFFNQRAEALTRFDGIDVDLFYRRMRTEQLRAFPNTEGPGLLFDDRSRRDNRFFRDRTGFYGEVRLRPYEAFDAPDTSEELGRRLAPELSLRGGYESRDRKVQPRFLRNPTNDWIGLSKNQDDSIADVGGGILLAPDGLLTMTLDFDYQRFRLDSGTLTEGDLGYGGSQATRTIGFVPRSNRYTGGARFNSRIGERAVLEGGFQISELEQVGGYTPDQSTAGLQDNSVRYYSANASADVSLVDDLSFNAFLKFDRRENDIERSTDLFNGSNGTQLAPFIENWQRFFTGGELELRMRGANLAAVGLRYEDVHRDREFADPGNARILSVNAHVRDDSRIVTVYGRTALRPWKSLSVSGELGYRSAPDTGYVVELDDNVYGRLRASYVFPWRRPLSLSTFLEGSTGENHDFSVVSGLGPDPAGPRLRRSFDATKVTWGVTGSLSPVDRLSTYVSFFLAHDQQDTRLDLSNLQRYVQDQVNIRFEKDGKSKFKNDQLSLILGSHLQLTDQTDGRLSYTFTHAKARYRGNSDELSCLISGGSCLELIAPNRKIDSDVHGIDFEVGHWVTDGLRVLAGYRFQYYDDDAPVPQSVASAVRPSRGSTRQHTATLGVTLTSDFFAR